MTPRTFTILAAVTAISLVAAAVSLSRDTGYKPLAGTGEKVFPELLARVNDASRLSIDGPRGTFTLDRLDDGWTMKESEGYSGRTVKVQRAILGLAQISLVDGKTRKPEKYSKLELQGRDAKGAKSKRVRVFDANGQLLADLLVGSDRKTLQGKASGGVYVRRPGEAQAWLASDNASDFGSEKKDWLERKIIDIPAKDVKSMTIRHPGGETVMLSKATLDTPEFTLENIPPGKKLIGPAGLDSVGGALANLQLDDVKNDPIPFDKDKTVTTDVATFSGLSVRVLTTENNGKFWITVDAAVGDGASKSATEKNHAIMARTGGWIYQISNYAASNLTRKLPELLEEAKPKS